MAKSIPKHKLHHFSALPDDAKDDYLRDNPELLRQDVVEWYLASAHNAGGQDWERLELWNRRRGGYLPGWDHYSPPPDLKAVEHACELETAQPCFCRASDKLRNAWAALYLAERLDDRQ